MEKYTTDLPRAQLDENGFAVNDGYAQIYQYHGVTKEYTGTQMVFVLKSFGIPADSCLDAPDVPVAENMAIVRTSDGKSWLHVPDYRGSVAYDKETKHLTEITELGGLPDNLTLDAPETPFDKWNGKKWVTDKSEQLAYEIAVAESQKQSLLAEAEQEIAMLERKVRLNMATDEDKVKLNEWEIYSVKVSDVDTSTAPDITWTAKP